MTSVTIQIGPIDAYDDADTRMQLLETSDLKSVPGGGASEKPTAWPYINYFADDYPVAESGDPFRYFVLGPPEDQTLIVGVPFMVPVTPTSEEMVTQRIHQPKGPAGSWIVIATRGYGATPTGIARICLLLSEVMKTLKYGTYLVDGVERAACDKRALETTLLVMKYVRCHIDDVSLMLGCWREHVIDTTLEVLQDNGSDKKSLDEIAKVLMYGPLAQMVVHPRDNITGDFRFALLLIIASHGDAITAVRPPLSSRSPQAYVLTEYDVVEKRLLDAEHALAWLGVDRHNCHLPTAVDAVSQYDLFVNNTFGASNENNGAWHRTLAKAARRALAVLQDPTAERFCHIHAFPQRTTNDTFEVQAPNGETWFLAISTIPAEPENIAVDATGALRFPSAFIYAVLQGSKVEVDLMEACKRYYAHNGGFNSLKTNLTFNEKGLSPIILAMSSGTTELFNGALLNFVIVDRTCNVPVGGGFISKSSMTTWSAVKQRADASTASLFGLSLTYRRELLESYFQRCLWRAIELISGDKYVEGCFEASSLLFHFGRYRVDQPKPAKALPRGAEAPIIVTLSPMPENELMCPQNHMLRVKAVDNASTVGNGQQGSTAATPASPSQPPVSSTAIFVEVYTLFAVEEAVSVEANVRNAEEAVTKLLRLYYDKSRPPPNG